MLMWEKSDDKYLLYKIVSWINGMKEKCVLLLESAFLIVWIKWINEREGKWLVWKCVRICESLK